MEPRVEKTLLRLVKKNVITLTLVDTPVHNGTPLYAKYFLQILNANRAIDYALRSRAVLFEAAKNKIEDARQLEYFLRQNDVKFLDGDFSTVFARLSTLIDQDAIKSTPSCVIVQNGNKKTYIGEADITGALQSLR
jgi:hypothetical protein